MVSTDPRIKSPNPIRSLSMLLLSDSPGHIQWLTAQLDPCSLQVVTVSSTAAALRWLKQQSCAVIAIDAQLAAEDFLLAVQAIGAVAAEQFTPMLAFSEQTLAPALLASAYELGVVDFFQPPDSSTIAIRAKLQAFTKLQEARINSLRESEQLRLLVHGTTEYAIFMLDRHGYVITWNAGAQRLKGYTADEIIGQRFTRFYPQDAIDRGWPDHELQVAGREGRFEDEGWRIRKDGTQFWANVVITALHNEQGQLVGFSKVTRDMTERKRAEQNALRLAEETAARQFAEENARLIQQERELLHVTLNSIGDGVISTDADGKVRFLNRIAENLVGWTTDQARDKPLPEVFNIINQTTRQPVENPAIRALREGVIIGLANHTILISKDGREYPIDDSAAPIQNADGQIVGSILVFRDMTDRKRAEAELREQTEIAETLLHISNLISQELELNKLVQKVTDEGTRLCGAQFGAFFYNVTDESGEAYTLYTLAGVPKSSFAGFPMPRNTALFGPTFRGEGVVRCDDVTRDPRYGHSAPYHGMPTGHLPVKSYLAVPVISRSGEVLGGLFLGHELPAVFNSFHERLLVGIASQASVAIDNARLYQRTQGTAERLGLALAAANMGDWSWQVENDRVTLSDRAAEVFGIPPGPHMTWQRMLELLHPDDRERTMAMVEQALATRGPYDAEYRVRQPAGDEVWVGVLGRAVYDEAGQPIGMFGVLKDINERKQLEFALRESSERLQLALEAGRMGVWDWNVRTGHLQWSDSLEKIHGLAPGTFDGTLNHFLQLVHPDDRSRVEDALHRAVEMGDEYQIEFRNVSPSGIRWIAGTGKLFPGNDGKPLRMIGIGMDVTRRKRSEQTSKFLADASAALSVLVDIDSTLQKVASLAVPYFADWVAVDLLEPDGRLRRVATAHVDANKVQLASEIHKRFPPDPLASSGIWNIARTGQPELAPIITDDMLQHAIKDVEFLEFIREIGLKSYLGVPLKIRDQTLGVLSFMMAESHHHYDQSDLEVAMDLASRAAIALENSKLYMNLREADQRKDEFLATLAHELRNPLAPIRNGLQVLRMASADLATISDARVMMERQLNHMVRLVDDLLDVSRITRNKLDLRKERITLESVVHAAVETSRPLIEQFSHHLSVQLPESPVFLYADPVRVSQAFSNLLNNSAKYTEPGGRIEVRVEVADGNAIVRVKDNGLGIPPEAMPHLFQMFSQIDRNMERAQGGLGIGLTLVRRLIEMHGGSVRANSPGAGLGSEFIVQLPVSPAHAPLEETPAPRSSLSSKRHRILVVDDNQDAALSLAMILRLMGNEICTAHDGVAANEVARDFQPDIILLDIGLPKRNGYEACRIMRQERWSKDSIIIALTGWGQDEDRRRSQEAGFNHHLVKPVSLAELESLFAHSDPTHATMRQT